MSDTLISVVAILLAVVLFQQVQQDNNGIFLGANFVYIKENNLY